MMKAKTKMTGALLALVMVVSGTVFYFSSGDLFEGRFPSSSPGGTWSLSSSSPSGARSVAVSDTIMEFNITAPSSKNVEFDNFTDSFKVFFETDSGDIDYDSTGTMVSLYMDGMKDRVGYGYIVTDYEEPETDVAAATLYFTWGVSVEAGDTQTFSIATDTSALMAEDAGVNDPLDVTVSYVTVLGAKSINGNTVNY